MLATIQFHNQFQLQAHEVGDITGDGNLSPELAASQLLQPQVLPQSTLGIRAYVT
jgi:hypothetical protein